MANNEKSFLNDISQTNIMPKGMVYPVNYNDYALLMIMRDKPKENKFIENHILK